MRLLSCLVGLACLGLGPAAAATEPQPDRPMLTRSGLLVAGRSLELEAGGAWQDRGFAAPFRAKVGFGVVETRLGANLGGIGQGAPGLAGGLKLGVLQKRSFGLAGYFDSAIPLGSSETWTGEAGGAITAAMEGGANLRFNAGILMDGSGGALTLAGLPLRGLVAIPVGAKLDPFAELQAIVGNGSPAWSMGGGLAFAPTEAVVLDVAAGWDFWDNAPRVQAGLTANLGQLK